MRRSSILAPVPSVALAITASETWYDELPAIRRVCLHRRIDEAVEELYERHVQRYRRRLAYHCRAIRLGA